MSDQPDLMAALEESLSEPPARTPRCGPFDVGDAGIGVCRKCGRLDPLDIADDLPD